MGKKSKGLGGSDYGAMMFGLLGPVTILGAALLMPMRMAKPMMEINWPNRWYYVLDATDMGNSRGAKYKMLKLELCQRFDMAQQTFGNPAGMLMGKFMSDGPLSSVTALVPTCDMKAPCREHLSTRCIWYEYLYFDGLCFFLANGMALAQNCLVVVIILILRKKEYKWYAMMIAISAMCMSCGVLTYWLMDTHLFLKDMQTQTVWPYAPFNGSGSKVVLGGIFLEFLCVVACFLSSRPDAPEPEMMPGMMGPPMGGMPPPQ
jgi:hypothetical protein